MTVLYIFLATTVLTAAISVVPLKRASDRNWSAWNAKRRRQQQMAAMAKGFGDFKIVLRDQLTPALQKAALPMAEFSKALDRREDKS